MPQLTHLDGPVVGTAPFALEALGHAPIMAVRPQPRRDGSLRRSILGTIDPPESP